MGTRVITEMLCDECECVIKHGAKFFHMRLDGAEAVYETNDDDCDKSLDPELAFGDADFCSIECAVDWFRSRLGELTND